MKSRADTYIDLIRDLEEVYDEGPEGRDAVNQLEHCLQMGTRAEHAGLSRRWVALSVLHDAFRVLAPLNHGPALALALEDILENDEAAVLKFHSDWQYDVVHGTDYARKQHRIQKWYADASMFGQLDAASFDPDYKSKDLAYFAPMIRELFGE